MISKQVVNGQCLIDFVLQHTGSLNYLVLVAKANNISPTGELVPGTALLVPEVNSEVVKYYQNNNIIPATNKLTIVPEGINHMAIEVDFYIR